MERDKYAISRSIVISNENHGSAHSELALASIEMNEW